MKVIVSDHLIRHLEEMYPDRMPQQKANIEEIRILQGQLSVVEYLKSLQDDEA